MNKDCLGCITKLQCGTRKIHDNWVSDHKFWWLDPNTEMGSFIFLICKVWFYHVDEENLAMSDCALLTVHLVIYSSDIYIYCGFINVSGWPSIYMDLYNENDSFKDK